MRKAEMQEGRGESAEWPYFDCWATKGGGSGKGVEIGAVDGGSREDAETQRKRGRVGG
jgi:hypothetical protein